MNRSVSISIILLCSVLTSSALWASEADTKALLRELASKASLVEQQQGTFTQTKQIRDFPVALESSGTFHFDRQLMQLRWETLTPVSSYLMISPEGMHDQHNAEPQAGTAQMAAGLLAAFTGDLSSLEEYFSIQASTQDEKWTLLLTPKHDVLATQIDSLSIFGEELGEGMILQEANGDRTELQWAYTLQNHAE